MKVVIQRVKEAGCEVNGKLVSHIGKGILVLVGIEKGDTTKDAQKLAYKCVNLRIFEDTDGKMNLSVKEVGGEVLVISQFTLCADCQKGLRPSFDNAELSEGAIVIYKKFIEFMRSQCLECPSPLEVKEGLFGAKMSIPLVNEGPATFILST